MVTSQSYGLAAPHNPKGSRREARYVYSQGDPAVYRGDTHFYDANGDLRRTEE